MFYQILSTYSLRKYVEISLENLYVDIGTYRVKNESQLVGGKPAGNFTIANKDLNPGLVRTNPTSSQGRT